MSNIIKKTSKDSESLYLSGERVFIVKSLGIRGSRLYEQLVPDRIFRVVCWDCEVSPEELIAEFLEVEASKAWTIPSAERKSDEIRIPKHADWKNARSARKKGQ